MATTGHTPGRLRADSCDAEPDCLYFDGDVQGLAAFVYAPEDDNRIEASANAARLALCWNSHDELVAALTGIIAPPDTPTPRPHGPDGG